MRYIPTEQQIAYLRRLGVPGFADADTSPSTKSTAAPSSPSGSPPLPHPKPPAPPPTATTAASHRHPVYVKPTLFERIAEWFRELFDDLF
jgi:hypothetical protein